jgi:NSS family neurotransmitter:Na+ symporter
MKRESWESRIGFILAVAGSAVGLANIWRFPYIVGAHGGAAFVCVYLLCLLLIGFPVFIAEILIGRTTQTSPSGAFRTLGGKKWTWAGKMTILTGFIVSSFYSAVAGWVLGYLIEAVSGNITSFQSASEATEHNLSLLGTPWWGVGFHFLFIVLCLGVLYMGVRKGIERGNKIMMPLLLILLVLLVIKGLTLEHAGEGLRFLFTPNWSLLTPASILIALGQAFFTLSLGQGTMVTYGSYLRTNSNLIKSCLPVVIMDTCVSLLAAMAVFTIVFSVGIKPDSGPALIFQTLPLVFSQLPGGYLLAILFFLLVSLAALTSEISAMEPTIAYLMDEWKWKRKSAVAACGICSFLIGIPSALSTSVLKDVTWMDLTFLDIVHNLASNILIPLGGLAAVLLVGWAWGMKKALPALREGTGDLFERHPILNRYFWFCIKYAAPILIILVFINSLTG